MADSNRPPNVTSNKVKKRNQRPNPNHVFRKRQPPKPETGDNVIYVSTKTSLKVLLKRCSKLINDNENEIIIYCLGAAIQRGILLALQLCERHVSYQHDTKTFSTTLIDDLEPAVDDADYEMQRRFNSALRIRVFPTNPLDLTS
ncbi:ribonuclease P protein subunit p20-like isoform X1 [Euwallacea similis]|uniref:ribonuclease P protein subunit p20-like isoform X1 n=1 Tax=Euwallacea similis TaxID=1736056 RepID=UPI00344BC29A